MAKILQLVAGGISSRAHRRHTEDGSIFNLQCRSELILGAARNRVAREGSTVREFVPSCTEERCRRALMRLPLTHMRMEARLFVQFAR